MTRIAVVYHSGFGHTKAIAEHVVRGAAGAPGARVDLISVDELPAPGPDRAYGGKWPLLDQADAIVFGTPTYMGNISGPFKMFMDATSAVWFQQKWKDKLAAGFTNSGSLSGDKVNTLHGLMTFAAQHQMIWVSQGVWPSAYTGDGKGLNRLGGWSGLITQADQGPADKTPGPEDRATAEAFGRRIAEAAARWARGKPA